jgi:REP-associated tyrosine transposase
MVARGAASRYYVSMPDSPNSTRRRSIRLPGHDYAQPGIYFVTICAQDRRCLFGDIENCELRHNAAGRLISFWWEKLPEKYPYVMLDAFVLMPNHLHGILHITDIGGVAGRPHGAAPTLGMMVAWFKSMTTNAYIRAIRTQDWPAFDSRLWQRNFYEHIVRNERELDSIREYILNNPAAWSSERENPAAIASQKQRVPWQI